MKKLQIHLVEKFDWIYDIYVKIYDNTIIPLEKINFDKTQILYCLSRESVNCQLKKN